jgi:hypothetical protein
MGDREMSLEWTKVDDGVYRSGCGRWMIRKVRDQRSCWLIEGPANKDGTGYCCYYATSLPKAKNIADHNRNLDAGVVSEESTEPDDVSGGANIWDRIMLEARKEEGRCMVDGKFRLLTFLCNLNIKFMLWDEFRGRDCTTLAWLAWLNIREGERTHKGCVVVDA